MVQQWSNAKHEGQITINAPAEKIYDILANIENLPAYIPGMSNAQRKNNELQATYAVQVLGAPINFPVEIRVVDGQKPTKIASQWSSLIKGTLQWNLQPNGNQTTVNAIVDYHMNIGEALDKVTSTGLGGVAGGLGKAAGSVVNSVASVLPSVVAANEGNFNTMLANLKAICEKSQP